MVGCRHCHSYDGQSWPEAAGKGKMHHVLILIFINIVLIQFPFFDPWLHQMFGSNEVTNPELSQILRFISYWEAIIAIFSSCLRWNWCSSLLTATWPNKSLQPEGESLVVEIILLVEIMLSIEIMLLVEIMLLRWHERLVLINLVKLNKLDVEFRWDISPELSQE